MQLTLENIKKSNPISKQEFGQLTDLLYSSAVVSAKEDVNQAKKKIQTLNFLIDFLKDYYEAQDWELDEPEESEAHFLDFLSKLYLQREMLQIISGEIKLKDIQASARSFALKTQYPVGMR